MIIETAFLIQGIFLLTELIIVVWWKRQPESKWTLDDVESDES
jgi:hypothetical protein